MKKFLFLLLAGLLVWGLGCQKDALDDFTLTKKVTLRDIDPAVQPAIDAGVAWLVLQQDATGRFGGDNNESVARTALAVTKLCDYSIEQGYTPQTGPYADAISAGLNYILANARTHTSGLIFNAGGVGHDVYNTGIAMMGIAAYRCPECVITTAGPANGMTHMQALQAAVNYFDAIQNLGGGWRYTDGSQPSDNSNSGFATLGLMAAEEFGCSVPALLKSNFSPWLDYIQNDGNGGSGYTQPDEWVNAMKTGNLLFEFAFVGDAPDAARVLQALGYIQNTWNENWNFPPPPGGWRPDCYLSMYCLMKGFVAMGIEEITVAGSQVDWFADISGAIVAQQLADGSWPGTFWTDPFVSTLLNLLTLEKITPEAVIQVSVDVKPGSCPNPINRKSKGVVPIAVLGSETFDVNDIDPLTVHLEDVYATKFSFEDVATPYTGGFSDPPSQYECTTQGPDGYTDFVFHIKMPTGQPEDAQKGDVLIVTIEGNLKDGRLFRGQDVIIIVQ